MTLSSFTDRTTFFLYNRFKDAAAVKFHQQNPAFHAFGAALTRNDLLEKPLFIKIVKPVKGFVRE